MSAREDSRARNGLASKRDVNPHGGQVVGCDVSGKHIIIQLRLRTRVRFIPAVSRFLFDAGGNRFSGDI